MLRHPHLAKLWYGDGRMRTALHNERQVREALNRPSLAQSLDDLTTTGVPVTLTEDGKVRRGHHTLILRARLTDRQFETTLSERSLRNAVIGTEISGQGQQESTTLSAGVELGISPRDHDKDPAAGVPRQAGNVSLGARYAQMRTRATKNTVAVAHDQLTFQNGADLYSYQVELGATFEGHRRPRGWTRLATVGLLGAGVFVSKVTERPLFARGAETVGRVELAVPAAHGSDRHAPADPPATGAAPAPAPAPVPRPLAATEADQLLDGTRPLPRTSASDRQLVNKLLSAPHVVLSTEGGEQRQRLVQDTADRATGTSWHVSAPGTPIRTALRRAMANLGVAGQLGQYLGPFGSRITGLTGAGPFSTHYLKAAVRGELDNVRVKSDPKPGSLEATIGNEHRVAGSSSTGARTTLGLQGAVTPLQQAPGQPAVVGAYSTALQYAWGKGRSISQTLTRGRNTTLSYAGRMYLVVADATETVAVRDRWTAAMGAVGTRAGGGISSAAGRISERLGRGLAPRRAAAALQRVRDAVMFHLPMQDAIEAGLAPDGLGTTTPANLGGGYKLPPFLRRRHFPSHPSGQLDASRAAQQLMGQLERMGVPSHDREQVLQRLSPDFLRSHVHELTTDGMALPVRYRTWTSPHHLPVGGSPGQLKLTLTPVTTTVERLRTGYELEDYRTTARDDVEGRSQDRGADVTLSASERAAGSGVLVANPALQGTAAKQRSSNVTEAVGSTTMPNIATTQAHAEIVTTYTLTATLVDASGKPLGPTATAPVGSLNEILPASLLTPDGAGADGALTEQGVREPDREVHVLTAEQARPEGIARWRTTDGESGETDPDILPFDEVIGSGILAVDILGSANVQDALTLATARADGFPGDTDLGKRHTGTTLTERVRMARHTPLTALGTAPAQAQQEATSQVGLTAGFREALGPDGSALPTQSSARLLGQSHTADSRLYAKMHRTGARLLAVENKPRMEAMQRRKTGDALEAGITDNIEGAVSTSPLAGNSNAGVTNPGATVPIGGANDSTTLRSATDTTLGTHIKVVTDRSMLFAVPVSWLSVAEVDHRVTDSRPMQALGKPKRGPRAVEAETTALVWLREDIARDYGLLDDTTFPDEARTAWDDQAKAAADLATAEKNYYDARAKARETWLDLSPEEQTALGDGAGATTPSPAVAASPAVTAWQTARDDVRRWQQRLDAAAQDHHRLHLAAARLTAHHQGSGSVPVKDVPQEYAAPDWRSEAPEPYKVTDATGSAPRTLTSPDGRTVREVHEVPHDGASFFHALLATAQDQGKLPFLLDADLADRFAAAPGDPALTAQAVGAVRDRLAWALADNGNEDLLDGLALDAADTFTQAELDYAEIDLTAAQQAEFDAFGRLPQTVWPSPEQRVALATAALYRPFTSEPAAADPDGRDPAPPERRAADHGGADVLPALAARILGTPVTVVTGEGRPQMFLPHGADPATADPASGPVLFAADGFFSAALTPGTVPPATTALPAPPTTVTSSGSTETTPKPPAHRSHPTPPWLPPTDTTGPRYRLDRNGLLTAPDGATYAQGTPAGRGNGFFGALSTALRHAAEQPGRDSRAAARLRTRAGASPAQLMRLNGLPGERAERDTLFSPPAPGDRKGTPALSQDALDGRLRRHLANAPWGPDADRAVAEWAAKATGATVTLIEENGTAHTYAGPSADAPVLRLRRRGGDFVPLLLRTPAPTPAPKASTPAPKTPTAAPKTPAPKSKTPEISPTGEGPGLPGEEEAYELSTLSGAEPQPQPQPHVNTDPGSDSDSDSDSEGEEDTPIWADPEWLTAVFGPQWNHAPRARLQETSEALYELVEEAAGGRTTRDGLADLVRHVLHLPTRARVSNQDVLDLGALALEASSDDLASAEDLALYFVDRQIETRRDALAEETLLRTADRTPAGRNFTEKDPGLPAPDAYLAERSGRAAEQNAAWRNPYLFVAGAAEGGGVEIVTPWRTFVVRDAEEMARIISYDSRRPAGADIVLALPPAFAAQVANLVAGTTARPVWYPMGPAEVLTHPTTGAAHLVVHRRAGEAGPDWTTPPPPQEPGLPGARDLINGGDTDSDDGRGSDAGSDSSSGSTSDGDAEFDRLADQLQWEHRIDALRPRPLITRDYQVIDDSGTGVLFTEPGPRTVGPVTAGEVRTEEGAEGPALILPQQIPGTVPAAGRPPLHISADRTVALLSAGDDTTGRGRQVYATRAAIERSSARLTAAGAGVLLEADPSVRVVLDQEDGTPGEPLFRVEPRFLTASGASEHAFTRDFARMVAGTDAAPLSHLAFRGPDGTVATAPVNGLHGREVTGTHHLAQALTEVADGTRTATAVTPDWAVRQAGRDPRFTGGVVGAPTPGEAYGQALSHTQDNALRGPLTRAAARAGVNEFAWAEVGEGYLIQSVSTTNAGGAQLFTHNHAKPGDPVGPHAPYHFAQVVLASEDGTHQITLENENHNRAEIPADQLDAVVDDNLDRYDEDQLTLLAQETGWRAEQARRDGADPAEIARLEGFARAARALAAVHEAEHVRWYFTEDRPEHGLAQREVDQARARARDAVRSAAPVPHDKDEWYFRAYSKRPGESAHAVNAALLSDRSPAVSNPLTTVALHGHTLRPDRRTVRFAEQQHTLSPGADENLDALALYLARTGLWNSANGLPLPTVTVTGHGNRSRASGEKRANAVGRALGDRLARLLRTFQEGAPGPHVRLSDFTLTLDAQRVRRATDPDRGRVVTVDIDDHRHTSSPESVRPTSGRPAPAGEPPRTEPPALTRPTGGPAPEGAPPLVTDPSTTGSRTSSTDRDPSRPGRRSATPSPDRGAPLPGWVRARIRYAEESVAFERRLAEHLAENEAVTEEFRKMARAAWDRARQQYPRALATFGSENPSMPGTVGTSRPALQQVLRTGNLRELVTFLFQGISSDLVPEMLGGREDPNPEIEAERPSRRQAEGRAELERLAAQLNLDDTLSAAEKKAALARATREHTVPTDPDDVRPPLSSAERPFAVNELGLTWMPASSVYDLAMSSGLQGTSEDSGGLVLTGTAGSTYRFLVHAARMRDQWGLELDLGLIRAGMIAMSLSAGHHSFHEVMRGAQLALDSLPGHDPALDYQDNWGRYWNIHPLTEQELREHVAREGRFPDEHAQEVLDADNPAPVPAPALNSAPPQAGAVPAGPDVDLDADQRRYLAEQLTADDLPPAPAPPGAEETVGSDELREAGVTLSPGLRAEMMLRGDGRLPAGGLSPLDLARVRLVRAEDGTEALDAVAASVARRLWAGTYAEVLDAAPEGRDDTETARAWSAAVALVLPPEPHPVLADARYAGEAFRDAVRRVAGHLLAAEGGAEGVRASAAELADSLRPGLGLAPRRTGPATGPRGGETAPGRPALQSRPGGDMPDLDMPDLDFGQGQGQDPGPGQLGDMDMDVDLDLDLGALDLPDAFPSAPDSLDLDALGDLGDLEDLPDFDFTFDLPAPVPVGPGAAGGQPVYAVPAAPPARPLTTLPALTLVPFAPQATGTADSAERGVERLAHQVARTALRNRRNRVPLPRIDIAGYGADARGAGTARDRDQAAQAQGDLRAQAVRDLFVRHLDHALRTLQAGLPAGVTPLRRQDFTISARGRSRVPGQGATVALTGQIGREELGRQATIGVTSPRHAAALDALDALRRTDPALRSGPLDVDAVARRIWHLTPSVLVDPEMRRDLYTLTGRAIAAGRATGLAALTAFHLEEQGLLADDRARHVTAGGNRVPGLNWTGTATAGLDTLFVDRLTTGPTGAPAPTGNADIAPWPWDPAPYPVLADGSHDRVTAQLPDGTPWELDADEFAELVAADLTRHALPERAPIVLAVPYAGDRYLALPRKLAERTGRTVWVHSGLAQRNPDPAATNTVAVLHPDGLPDGTWLPVRPGLAPDPDDGAPAWHREVLTQPIVSSRTGQQTGRSFHQPAELVGERESYRDLDHMSFYVHWDAATNTYSGKLPMRDPGPADKAYRLAGHGLPGGLSLPLADGSSRTVDRDEAAGWLRRRRSLTSLPQDHWVDLVICHSGAPGQGSAQDVSQLDGVLPAPFTTDPLGDDALSLGQHLANQLRRTTRLSYSSQGVVRFGDGPVRVLATDAQGRPWWWETSHPEPDDAELDRLAEQAGFQGDPSPRVRSELLRVVRALKLVVGPDVQAADDFPALVTGAAAIVNMWFADPDLQPTGPFWPQLLTQVIAAHPLAAGGVDGDVTRQVLAEAAKAWRNAGGALPVSSFVPLPQLRTAAAWLAGPAAVDRAAVDALRLTDPADAPAHRTRMFWARVRAEEALPGPGPAADLLTVRALRLDQDAQVDDALRDRARALLTRGFAAGRNMADPDVAGAYAIEAAGALAAPALLTTVGAAFGSGRDWRGLATLLPRLDGFRVADTTVDAPWAGPGADGTDRPVPYAVRASVDLEDSSHVQVTVGVATHRLSAAEFAELLSSDTDLQGIQSSAPVLLLLDGLSGPAPEVAETVARRLGRPVWWSTSPVELSAPDAAEGELPVLAPDLSTLSQPSSTDWRFTAPSVPDLGARTVPATSAPGPGAPTPATNSEPGAGNSRIGDPAAAPADTTPIAVRNPRSSVGDPMEGVESTSVPTAPAAPTLPAVPVAPASVRALQPLPPRTLVAYGRDETSPSAQGDRTLELLAAQVAATGLRNRRAGASLPRVEVTGYGAEIRPDRPSSGSPARRRATTARHRFTRLLAAELERLQRDLPADAPRLTAQEFGIVVKAMARVPADWVGTGALAQVTRAELGRQATVVLHQPPDAVAVQKLDSLRRRDRALRDQPFDVDAIARRVLHLDPGAPVQQDTRQELFGLVGRATAAGRATGFPALAAYHLSELGVTAPGRAQHFTVGGSRVPGLNWGTSDVIRLDTTQGDLLEADPAGGYDAVSTSPTPWPSSTTPYVVAAEGGPDQVEARLPDGTVRELGIEEFVELVAADLAREALPPGTPVVLAVPFAADGYLGLPRRLADRTGRTVWAHSGRITVESAPGEASTIDVVRTPKTPRGDWIASDPGLGPDTDDDTPGWHHDVVSRALVSALSGRQIGRASHHPAEFARDFEDDDRHLDRMATFVHDHPATGRTSGEYDLPRPGPEDRAYRLDLHGSPGSLTFALRDGTTRDIDEREAGPWLRRRKSLTTLPDDHWVDLVVCWSGAPRDSAVPEPGTASDAYGGPFVADPLATVSMGQHVANATGRAVRLAYGPQGTQESNGRYRRTLFADAQGRRRAWALASPEPDAGELDRLAEIAGISPGDGEVSDEMRTATLRLVRALRITFGHDIDDDPGFDDLLRGAAAVDQMWRSDSDFEEAGPFTLDLLHRVVAAHPEAAAGVDRQTTRRVLAAAAEQWARYPGDGLVGFVDLPAVEAAAQWLAEGDAEDEAAAVLRLRTDEVGEAEMSRMFWARVKAEETLPGVGQGTQEFAARVLHQEPDPGAAHARRTEALDVLTRAFAVGREASDPDIAAAYALKEAGAYDDTALDTVQGTADGTGRDYTGGPAQDVDLARFRTPTGLADAPWAQGKDRPAPYLVRAGADADDPDLVEVSWGGDTYEATADEFAELLAADTALARTELTVPVVLALPGPAADAATLADLIARRLGRTVWWTGFPADLSGTGDAGDPVLTLHPAADGTAPGVAPWQRARPAHPASAEDAPRPVPAPLPRSRPSDDDRTGASAPAL
ncbi:protein of unknown function [Streptomyces sp. KY75]|nr:protein of unknown function [Streptomyces sp. KY75]